MRSSSTNTLAKFSYEKEQSLINEDRWQSQQQQRAWQWHEHENKFNEDKFQRRHFDASFVSLKMFLAPKTALMPIFRVASAFSDVVASAQKCSF